MPPRISVEARGRRGIDIADIVCIFAVGCPRAIFVVDVGGGVVAAVQTRQNIFRVLSKFHAEMVDELELAVSIHSSKQRKLRVGGAAMDQRAAGIIAHTARHRSADAA